MKKIIFFTICLFLFMDVTYASCTYAEEKMLNTIASYVDYTYDFNESTKSFDLTIYNVNEYLAVRREANKLDVKEEQILINGLQEGERISLNIISGKSYLCTTKELRVISITMPYINTFYGNEKCITHMNNKVCYSKYLDYKLTKNAFESALNPLTIERENNIIDNTNIFNIDTIIEFIKNYWIGMMVSILTIIISVLVWSSIYRKIKHKI